MKKEKNNIRKIINNINKELDNNKELRLLIKENKRQEINKYINDKYNKDNEYNILIENFYIDNDDFRELERNKINYSFRISDYFKTILLDAVFYIIKLNDRREIILTWRLDGNSLIIHDNFGEIKRCLYLNNFDIEERDKRQETRDNINRFLKEINKYNNIVEIYIYDVLNNLDDKKYKKFKLEDLIDELISVFKKKD